MNCACLIFRASKSPSIMALRVLILNLKLLLHFFAYLALEQFSLWCSILQQRQYLPIPITFVHTNKRIVKATPTNGRQRNMSIKLFIKGQYSIIWHDAAHFRLFCCRIHKKLLANVEKFLNCACYFLIITDHTSDKCQRMYLLHFSHYLLVLK